MNVTTHTFSYTGDLKRHHNFATKSLLFDKKIEFKYGLGSASPKHHVGITLNMYVDLTPKCLKWQKVVASVFQIYLSQGDLAFFLVLFLALWTNNVMSYLNQTSENDLLTTSKYGPWMVGTLNFYMSQNSLFGKRNNVNDMKVLNVPPPPPQTLRDWHFWPIASKIDWFWSVYEK